MSTTASTPTDLASPWQTCAEAHAYTGISERHLKRLVATGELRAYRRGRIFRFHREDLDAFLLEGIVSGPSVA